MFIEPLCLLLLLYLSEHITDSNWTDFSVPETWENIYTSW